MSGLILKEDDPLHGPVDLEWIRKNLRNSSPEEYLAHYNCPGMLLSLREPNAPNLTAEEINAGDTFQGMHSKEALRRFGLVLVAKRPRNTLLPLMITVGRSENIDIALNFPTISKLHAFFYQVGVNWVLVDAGSSNGTFVEGLKLKGREPYSLQEGQTIDFGFDVSCKFMLPKKLVAFLFE
jgi:hypothetical protein